MRHFRRTRRWRQIFIAFCLPYVLASVLVDFVHVHPPAAAAPTVAGSAAIAQPSRSAPQPDYTCTVCVWLRSGLQLTPNTTDTLAAGVTATAFVLTPDAVRPDAPIARSELLRGPPSSLLA